MSIMGRMLQYRGAEQDFDADKMLPGMFAVSTDKKYVRMCFSPGVVERIALYEAFEEDMKQIQLILATCEDIQVAVEAFNDLGRQYAEKAESEADRARNEADEAEACAIRAEEAAARAEAVTDIGIATADKAGIIKANADEFAVSLDGKLSLTSSYEEQESLEEITGTESKKTLFGKLAKAIEEFKTHIGNNNIHYTLSNNLLATVAGTALDAVQGKNLDNRITELNRNFDMSAVQSIESAYLPFTIRKYGKIVELTFGRNKAAMLANTSYTIGTIPEGYRSVSSVTQMIPIGRNGGVAYIGISSNGAMGITPYINLNAADYTYGRIVYFCA